MMDHMEEAIRVSNEIGDPKASVRARYYMLVQRFIGGDLDGALRIAVDCLNLADPTEHLYLASIHSVLGVILYKKGFVNPALLIGDDESVFQSVKSQNPGIGY